MICNGQYSTPEFAPDDPIVSLYIRLRPSIWEAVLGALADMGQECAWCQPTPSHATPAEVIAEINKQNAVIPLQRGFMIGQVIELPVDFPPAWLLLCDGSTYDDADYPELGAVIHAGLRVDATHFRVPQREVRFALGGALVGTQGGEEFHTLTVAEMPAHTHAYDQVTPTLVDANPPPAMIGIDDINAVNTGSTGGGDPHNNMPPYEETAFFIVARHPQAGD